MNISGDKIYTVHFPEEIDIKTWFKENTKPIGKEYSPNKEDLFLLLMNHKIFYVIFLGKGKKSYKRFIKHLSDVEEAEKSAKRPKTLRTKGQVFLLTCPALEGCLPVKSAVIPFGF